MTHNCQNCGVSLAGDVETCPFCSFEVALNLSAATTQAKLRAFLAVIRLGLLVIVLGVGLVIVWDVFRQELHRQAEESRAQPYQVKQAQDRPTSIATLLALHNYARASQVLREKIRQHPDEREEWRFQLVAALILEEFSKGQGMLHPGVDFQSTVASLYKDYPDSERTRALEELLAHLWGRPGGYVDLRRLAKQRSAFVRWCGDEVSQFDSMFAQNRRSLRPMDYRSLSYFVPR